MMLQQQHQIRAYQHFLCNRNIFRNAGGARGSLKPDEAPHRPGNPVNEAIFPALAGTQVGHPAPGLSLTQGGVFLGRRGAVPSLAPRRGALPERLLQIQPLRGADASSA
ncbi:MAG: hypothetical protein ACI4NA_08955 [Succinivibrio sp.]